MFSFAVKTENLAFLWKDRDDFGVGPFCDKGFCYPHLGGSIDRMAKLTCTTPLGDVTLVEEGGAIVALDWGGRHEERTPVLEAAEGQLDAYFAGNLRVFDLPLAPKVSERQQDFLDALIAIPFGETKTYGELARETGMSAQGAGQACGANPIAIIIPCHRVIGTGNLGGFSARGGVETKVALLKHEGAASLLI